MEWDVTAEFLQGKSSRVPGHVFTGTLVQSSAGALLICGTDGNAWEMGE